MKRSIGSIDYVMFWELNFALCFDRRLLIGFNFTVIGYQMISLKAPINFLETIIIT